MELFCISNFSKNVFEIFVIFWSLIIMSFAKSEQGWRIKLATLKRYEVVSDSLAGGPHRPGAQDPEGRDVSVVEEASDVVENVEVERELLFRQNLFFLILFSVLSVK